MPLGAIFGRRPLITHIHRLATSGHHLNAVTAEHCPTRLQASLTVRATPGESNGAIEMWVCTACTLENENDAYLSCAVCGTTRAPENDDAEDSRKRQREETAPAVPAARRRTFDLAQLGKRPRAAPTVPAPPPTASPRAPSRPSFDLGRLRSLPARPCTVRDGDAPPRSVADAEVPSVAPAHIVRRVLPPALADALLRKLLADGDWHRGTWTVGGKTSVNARRTRSFRIRMTGGGEFEALGGGADAQAREENGSSRARGYAACPELLEAARFVTAAARRGGPAELEGRLGAYCGVRQ